MSQDPDLHQQVRSELERAVEVLRLAQAQVDRLAGLLTATGDHSRMSDRPEDDLDRLLIELRRLVLRHPIAAQAAYRALIAEGRRFAETADGQRWKQRLAGSALVQRGQLVWEVGTSNALGGDEPAVLPSQLIDAFCRAVAREDLEATLGARAEGG